MIIAGLDRQDATVAHPTHTDPVLLEKNNRCASVAFDPSFLSTSYPPCKVLQQRPVVVADVVTNDESS